ncbi:MAG: glycosyltransferase, partial [Planctomycetales bacterium]|nr:glycosyltransferase [Planctomycetales bacterium]
PEMVCEGRTGFTYEPLSSDELRGLVRRVFSSPSPQLRVQARAEFERNYSPRINHQILMDIYQQAISRAGD